MTWEDFKKTRNYQTANGEIFVNVNHFLRMFIRARRGLGETKTFNYTKRGYSQALRWVQEV